MIDTCTTNEEQISREQGVACVERRSIQYVDNMSGSVSRGVTRREANTTKGQLGTVRHLAALHTHSRHHQYIIIQGQLGSVRHLAALHTHTHAIINISSFKMPGQFVLVMQASLRLILSDRQ